MNLLPIRLVPLSAAVLLAFGSLHALGAPAPSLMLGETLVVTANAPVDAAPTPCTATTTAGTFTCTNLRSAIEHANNNGNGSASYDRIVLANGSTHTLSVARDAATEDIDAVVTPAAGTPYNNLVGDLDIIEPVTIETTDNTQARATIQGGTGFNDRLLHVGPAAILNVNNLVLTKGQGLAMNGGALYSAGTVTIARSVVTDNAASWDMVLGTEPTQGNGGGIYSTGPLTILFSTLSKNTASTTDTAVPPNKVGNGGAIYSSHSLTLTDSTIGGGAAGNVAINGGGIQQAGGNGLVIDRSTLSYNDAVSGGAINVVSTSVSPFTVTNSTISTNHVTDSGAGINTNTSVTLNNTTIADNAKDSSTKGSGINQFSGTVTLHNTLLVNNTAISSTGATISANCGKAGTGSSGILSSGGNLSTDATCALLDATDQQSVADAKIGPLALNDNTYSGNLTHALLTGSPAINKGTVSNCPATDERNVTRPQGSVCDVGAYELIITPATSSSSGCSMANGDVPLDPTLPALAALGLLGLGLRRSRRC